MKTVGTALGAKNTMIRDDPQKMWHFIRRLTTLGITRLMDPEAEHAPVRPTRGQTNRGRSEFPNGGLGLTGGEFDQELMTRRPLEQSAVVEEELLADVLRALGSSDVRSMALHLGECELRLRIGLVVAELLPHPVGRVGSNGMRHVALSLNDPGPRVFFHEFKHVLP